MMPVDPVPKFNDILCIGLGLSGICVGVQLKRKFGSVDIHFYDRNASHSGTWWVNSYPGCACDIPALFYSFSFELNPNWTRLLPSKAEIQQYLDGVVDKYQLRPRMTFLTECESARWDSTRQLWSVHLRNLTTGERYVHECRLLFSAVGVLVDPKDPNMPGKETFQGPMFHTARWRSDVDLADKNVIVVGNGCSGTQVVPKITSMTKTLTQFINTPHWLMRRTNSDFSPTKRWAFRNIPLLVRIFRLYVFIIFESGWRMFHLTKSGAKLRQAYEKDAIAFTLGMTPEKYHDILIPDFSYACKRRVADDGTYFRTLHAPNLHLTKDPILEILPRGVRTASKTYPADVIILATGFQTSKCLGALNIQGRDDEWLEDRWKKAGGPGAYNNTAIHGYPNFFIIYGPNSSTGHSSVLLTIENMVNYALKVAAPVIKGEALEVEVKDEAEKAHLRELQAASRGKVWNTCKSWYVPNGWNSILYPWSQTYFWWRSTFPTWRDWHYTGKTAPSRRLGVRTASLLVLVTVSVIGSVLLNGPRWPIALSGSHWPIDLVSKLLQQRKTWS